MGVGLEVLHLMPCNGDDIAGAEVGRASVALATKPCIDAFIKELAAKTETTIRDLEAAGYVGSAAHYLAAKKSVSQVAGAIRASRRHTNLMISEA